VLHAEKSQPYAQAYLLLRVHMAKELALLSTLIENVSNTFYIGFRDRKNIGRHFKEFIKRRIE